MNIGELVTVKTIENKNAFDEKHTPYSAEIRLLSCVQQGDIESLITQLKNLDSIIVMGRMSDDELMQNKYMAVSTITLATRYAIQGGLNETKAYEFSDRVINTIDKLTDKNEKQIPWLEGLEKLSDNGGFSRKKLNLLKEASEIFNCVVPADSTPVLIHGDLNIMNIMADVKTFNLIAFIDPCGSIWADREYDLFQFRNMWGDAYGLYETYKQKYKLSEYADFRVAYYGAMLEASMRLKGGHIVPLWEDLDFARLKKEMKKLKEKM